MKNKLTKRVLAAAMGTTGPTVFIIWMILLSIPSKMC